MKKLGISLLCCVLVLSGCFLFTGCKSELDKYNDLKEMLFELQLNSADLHNDYIYLTGKRHSNSGYTDYTDYRISLEELIITENVIVECKYQNNYYWFYFNIKSIKDKNNNFIWENS